MTRIYRYVGPKEIAQRAPPTPRSARIESPGDVIHWIRQSGQRPDPSGHVTATFIVDEEGWLRISDRRSEHVACAGGKPVQSAGEISFQVTPAGLHVAWVSNQSTGYCPEADSWPAVQESLLRAGITAPERFSQAFVFRRCPRCGAINLVKEELFACDICSAPLPAEWNFDRPDA